MRILHRSRKPLLIEPILLLLLIQLARRDPAVMPGQGRKVRSSSRATALQPLESFVR